MSDEKFEEFLQREARSYNAPRGEVPREEMRQAVAAARAEAGFASLRGQEAPLAVSRSRRRFMYAGIGMAATLVLGVGVGRFAWRSHGTEPLGLRGAPVVASTLQDNAAGEASYQVAVVDHLSR